jgi:hypothetical protein
MNHPKISSLRYNYSNYSSNSPTRMQNSDLIIDLKIFKVVKHFINTILYTLNHPNQKS